jgi:putative methionine-R-sulfoxide reductase with GAF domain
LSGAAISARSTVVSDDGPGSETIVPILGAESGIVIGTLDAQSDRTGAFSAGDVAFLEECAEVLRPLYD